MESTVRAHFTVEMDSDSELSDCARTRVLELDDIQEGVKHMLKVGLLGRAVMLLVQPRFCCAVDAFCTLPPLSFSKLDSPT